jgi:Ca2+/Na+ antiporter
MTKALARRRQSKRTDRLASVFAIYGVGLACIAAVYIYRPATSPLAGSADFEAAAASRKLIVRTDPDPEVCRPKVEKIVKSEFPEDLFCPDSDFANKTLYPDGTDYSKCDSLTNGGILLHVFAIIVMFYGIALLCDNYFEPALERICEFLDLEDDVAGATFMAAGGSAPELATSMLGTFVTKSDIGIGTIVGSAVFNVLFVIAVCAFCAPNLKLTWWPLARDCIYYCFSIMVLTGVIFDNVVKWWEAVLLFCLYLLYVFMMSRNVSLHRYAEAAIKKNDEIKTRGKLADQVKYLLYDNNMVQIFIYAVITINLIGSVAQPFGDNEKLHYYSSDNLIDKTTNSTGIGSVIDNNAGTVEVSQVLYDFVKTGTGVTYTGTIDSQGNRLELNHLGEPDGCDDSTQASCDKHWYVYKPIQANAGGWGKSSGAGSRRIALFDSADNAAYAEENARNTHTNRPRPCIVHHSNRNFEYWKR